MIQLKNTNELIIFLLKEGDQKTLELLFNGKLLPCLGGDDYKNKCSLKALKFIYSILPKDSEKVLFYVSYDRGGENNGPINLVDWITKKEYEIGVFHNVIIDVKEIISSLGYYFTEELGELINSSSNSDGEGFDSWERLYYLNNEKYRRSQNLRDILRNKSQNREFYRMYNSKNKKVLALI